jgi:hypothetical protein
LGVLHYLEYVIKVVLMYIQMCHAVYMVAPNK